MFKSFAFYFVMVALAFVVLTAIVAVTAQNGGPVKSAIDSFIAKMKAVSGDMGKESVRLREAATVSTLRSIVGAQAVYKSEYGSYASKLSHLDCTIRSTSYKFSLKSGKQTYSVSATTKEKGAKKFYVDQTGVVRLNDAMGPEFKEPPPPTPENKPEGKRLAPSRK